MTPPTPSPSTSHQPTEQELKLGLAKLLPSELLRCPCGSADCSNYTWLSSYAPVKDTEWLHITWLIEQTLSVKEGLAYAESLANKHRDQETIMPYYEIMFLVSHTSWQQRALALLTLKELLK